MSMYFFPTPYEDELLYSILARYCRQSGNIDTIHNIDDLFGTRNIVASPELPGKIDMLISNLPNNNYTSDYFIQKHTMFPYIASFLPEERAREVSALMKNGQVSLIYNKSGIISSGSITQNRQFRFCPECMREDIQTKGETFWRRLFQITEVLICPQHRIPLQDSTVSMRGTYRQSFISADDDNCLPMNLNRFSDEVSTNLMVVAKDVQKILKGEFTYQSVDKHKFMYLQKLIEMNFANLNGMVHQKKLRNAMLEFLGEDVLKILQCPIEPNKDCLWLNSLVRENGISSQPIRHILLCRFLGINIEKLLDCKDSSQSHRELWEEKLLSLINKGLSIREIAKILDSTPKTVRKKMNKHEIGQFWINNGGGKYLKTPYVDTSEFINRRDKARETWLQLMKEHPDLSRNKIKKVDETLYTRLIRYDKEWLDIHAPAVKCQRQSYWNEKDMQLLPEVVAIVNDMYCGKPERILWTTVGGKLGISGWFAKRKDKMPHVKAFLDERVETLQKFQVRKLEWAINELEEEGELITKWKLLEKAGIKPRFIDDISKNIREKLSERGYNINLLK